MVGRFSYPVRRFRTCSDIGDHATIFLWCLGIWPWFDMAIWAMAFGRPTWYIGYLPSPVLFALYNSISLLQGNIVCLSHPPALVYTSITPGLCNAWEFGSARAGEHARSGLYLHITPALLRLNHYLHVPYSLVVFQLSMNEETKRP